MGRLTNTVWVPGHLRTEGTYLIGAGLSTRDPYAVHFFAQYAVVCRTIDPHNGPGVRGDWVGNFPGYRAPPLGVVDDV